MMMAVAGRTKGRIYCFLKHSPPGLERRVTQKDVGAPINEGPDYMKKGSVTVGRAGRLSVHTLDERALGMRERLTLLPACETIIGHGEWLVE